MKTNALLTSRPSLLAATAFSFLSVAMSADAALFLAFGVDTSATATTFEQIRVRDLHGDHYHNFTENNGTAGGHTPLPFELTPGSGVPATLELGSMDNAPFASSRYTTALTPAGDFHLKLIGWSGPGAENLTVAFWHGDHTHGMGIDSEEHLEIDAVNRIDFSLPSGAPLGSYTAQFQLIDESANYSDSPVLTFHVNAVPEPSSALLGAGAFCFALLRRKRA
ncbi:PEP-CTERM sorting domain-containing protein [Haloferula chungangensis]|uniref:PEP-CTERM sorting domain-containing protein n=1 Tax=Haloferula chungangensis TaxID=1048331 RepID=A0ABW2L6G7_9BACT